MLNTAERIRMLSPSNGPKVLCISEEARVHLLRNRMPAHFSMSWSCELDDAVIQFAQQTRFNVIITPVSRAPDAGNFITRVDFQGKQDNDRFWQSHYQASLDRIQKLQETGAIIIAYTGASESAIDFICRRPFINELVRKSLYIEDDAARLIEMVERMIK